MTYALSREGLECVRKVSGENALLAFDIDGTLAPIASQPWAARIPDDIQRMLSFLNGVRKVAVVTGRSVADARRMLAFEPAYLVGSHGAEGVPGHAADAGALELVTRGWIAGFAALGDRWPPATGVLLEDKGCSIAIHYRHAVDRDHALRHIEQHAMQLSPRPRLIRGKCVLNLLPAGAPHKGDALRALLADSGRERAIYVGDDVTDEDVFRLRLPGVLSVRVAPVGERTTDLYLAFQEEVGLLLRELTGMIDHEPAGFLHTRV
ncbi:MAG: trehalose-phosphatase [Betaproteobacteria bacterium]